MKNPCLSDKAADVVLVDMRVCASCPHMLKGHYVPMYQCRVLGRGKAVYRLTDRYILPNCCIRQLEHIMAQALC